MNKNERIKKLADKIYNDYVTNGWKNVSLKDCELEAIYYIDTEVITIQEADKFLKQQKEQNKYYIPKIEQFVVGFEYELQDDNGDWLWNNSPQDKELIEKCIKDGRCRALAVNYNNMKNIENLEVIQLNTNKEGKLIATISYQDTTVQDLNNGYSIIDVPVNVRALQLSSRDNILVDQSVKGEYVSVANER